MTLPSIKICYALWDRVNSYQDEDLRQILIDLNFALDSILMPVIDGDLMEMIRWAANETDYSHMVIFDTGTVLGNSDKLRKAWHELCEKDWLVAGHIMLRASDSYPWLHPQCFGINLHHWKEAGRPEIGLRDNTSHRLSAVHRSPDNWHDDYTPLWLRPAGHKVHVSDVRFGWQVIDTSMSRGLTVENLPMDVRANKMYIYPDDRSDRLVSMTRLIRNGIDCDVDGVENDSQRRFFKNQQWMSSDGNMGSVFVFNTGDALINAELWEKPGAIWATASGFKPFLEWHYRSREIDCAINLFDYNQASLDLWSEIQTDWDGCDLYSFLRAIRPDCDDENRYCWGNKYDHETPQETSYRQEAEMHAFCGGQTAFHESWSRYRQLKHSYHRINLITDPARFAHLMDPNLLNYVWINNIYYFNRSIRRYGIMRLGESLSKMLTTMVDAGIPNRVCGQSANAHFFDSAADILPILAENPAPMYQCQLEFRTAGVRRWAGHPLAF